MPNPSQLSLFGDPSPEAAVGSHPPPRIDLRAEAGRLATQLSQRLSLDVRLAVTDNRSTVISYQRRPHAVVLRVHRMFLAAPEPVIQALAAYVSQGNRRANPALDRFIRQHRDALRTTAKPRHLRSRGLFHDLQTLFDRLNTLHFDNAIQARIGWSRVTTREQSHRSIRMGVYLHDERIIRIHPALDRPEVPDFFVAFVVFHEMLHQAIPAQKGEGRSQHHGPEFRARERAYPDYDLAIAWEKGHLNQLLGIRRRSNWKLD